MYYHIVPYAPGDANTIAVPLLLLPSSQSVIIREPSAQTTRGRR